MVLSGTPEPPATAGTAVPEGVSVAAAAVVDALADTVVDEARVEEEADLVVEVAFVDDDGDDSVSVESRRIWPSFEPASSQLFCFASYMQSTSFSFPPAITTVPSAP
jgi:hypothetical protein